MTRPHLPARFFRALWPGRPRRADDEWACGFLTPEEIELWRRLPNHDRRHAIRGARYTQAALTHTEYADDPQWIEAALLHDVGKQAAGLGVYGRVVATVASHLAGREMAEAWRANRGFTRKVGLYVDHGAIGADMIRMANGSEAAAQWSVLHHEPRSSWFDSVIPGPVLTVLDDADHA